MDAISEYWPDWRSCWNFIFPMLIKSKFSPNVKVFTHFWIFDTKFRKRRENIVFPDVTESSLSHDVIRQHRVCPTGFGMRYEAECDILENFDTNECPNIFVSTKLHKWISEYIHTNFFDTNECPNKYSYWKLNEYSNIRAIFNTNTYSDIHSCQTN